MSTAQHDALYYVGIGGQRCGTTWLYNYLQRHPEVLRQPYKELHVFDQRFLSRKGPIVPPRWHEMLVELEEPTGAWLKEQAANRPQRLRRWIESRRKLIEIVGASDDAEAIDLYRAYFLDRLKPTIRAYGDITPGYSRLGADGFAAILNAFPDARFLYCLRDPVDRFWSSTRHVRSADATDDKSIDQLLAHKKFEFGSRYEVTLERLRSVASEEQIKLYFFEDLFGPDGEDDLRGISDFLHISYVPGRLERPVNRGISRGMDARDARRVADHYSSTYSAIRETMGRLPERWANHESLVSS